MTLNTAVLFSSARGDWTTPTELIARIDSFYGGDWLDPCPATPTFDALAGPWPTSAHIYLNPPYGRSIGTWVARALAESHQLGAELIMLLPARTDTRWFQPLFSRADAICWIAGRLKFGGQSNSAPFPSALVYLGPRAEAFRAQFRHYGHVTLTPCDGPAGRAKGAAAHDPS
jgi:hypothetical protein